MSAITWNWNSPSTNFISQSAPKKGFDSQDESDPFFSGMKKQKLQIQIMVEPFAPPAGVASRFGICARFLFRKNFRGETQYFHGRIPPGIARQPGFYTGFFEQALA